MRVFSTAIATSKGLVPRLLLASMALLYCSANLFAEPLPEDLVKAAVIFKLTKFVEWPDYAFDNASSLNLCAVASESMTEALQRIHGRFSNGRAVRFINLEPRDQETICHVFVGPSPTDEQMLATIGKPKSAVLTISGSEGFADTVGIIELRENADRLEFRVNLGNARKANITLSSTLLELAEVVQ